MERLKLPAREADERIAVAQGVVDERQRLLPGQRGEPEGDLGEVDGHGVAVDAVEAALGDPAARDDDLILAGRELWSGAVGAPPPSNKAAKASAVSPPASNFP